MRGVCFKAEISSSYHGRSTASLTLGPVLRCPDWTNGRWLHTDQAPDSNNRLWALDTRLQGRPTNDPLLGAQALQ